MSVYDFSEIMKGKKVEERAAAFSGEKPAPTKPEKPKKKLNTNTPSELLWYLMQKSEKRICKHFEQYFADVEFCQIEEIEKRITRSKYDAEIKQAIGHIVLGEMKSEGFVVEDLLRKVHRLGLSHIPRWKNFCAQQVPGPISLLRMISTGEAVIPYQKVK